MKQTIKSILALILLISAAVLLTPYYANSSDTEYSFNIGVYTKHYIKDKSSYNEDSHFYQFTAARDNKFLTAGTFKNSYNARSRFIGLGAEFDLEYIDKIKFGYYLAAVHGYDSHRTTHYKGLLFLPIKIIRYNQAVVTIMGSVINLGFEVKY